MRKGNITDSACAFKNWMSNENVCKFLTWPPHKNEDITKSILNGWIDEYKNLGFYQWIIELKDINEVIGTISSVNTDDNLNSISIGYCIGEPWWGKGLVKEALDKVIEFFFEEVDTNIINASHAVGNPNSGKVMQKAGMIFEGVRRQSARCIQGVTDVAWYSITKEEYFSKKQ